jgi:hypothetical protein
MRKLACSLALAGAATLTPFAASAAPGTGTAPSIDTKAVQKVQGFGIYVGPGYGYDDSYYGYGYGYRPYYGYRSYDYYPNAYYYGPRSYYYGYSSNRKARAFRRLDRRAP